VHIGIIDIEKVHLLVLIKELNHLIKQYCLVVNVYTNNEYNIIEYYIRPCSV